MSNPGYKRLQQFRIVRKLGAGAFGDVYKVERRSNGETYALKKVNIASMDKREVQDSLNEIRFLASLRHPNIVGFMEAFLNERTSELCIVMEYADGGDLNQRIEEAKKKKRYIDERMIWAFAIQLLEGVEALHSKKILHRDIKPANCFLTADNHLKLGDLNVSKLARHGLVKTQIGTPYYMSPEIWDNRPYDGRSDMWAVGCVLYELAALRPPYRGTDLEDLARRVKSGFYAKIPSQYSTDLSELIRVLLSRDPKKRPSVTTALSMPGVTKQRAKLKQVLDETLKSQLDMVAAPDLLGTIAVPRNITRLTNALPGPCYPDSRPQSPSAWPVSARSRMDKMFQSERRLSDAKPKQLEKKLSDPYPMPSVGIAGVRKAARADVRDPPASGRGHDRRRDHRESDASRYSKAPGSARHLPRPAPVPRNKRPGGYGHGHGYGHKPSHGHHGYGGPPGGGGGGGGPVPASGRAAAAPVHPAKSKFDRPGLPPVSRSPPGRAAGARAGAGADPRAHLPTHLAVGLNNRPEPRRSRAAAVPTRGMHGVPSVPGSRYAAPSSVRSSASVASNGYQQRRVSGVSARGRTNYSSPSWWG